MHKIEGRVYPLEKQVDLSYTGMQSLFIVKLYETYKCSLCG